MAPKKRRSRVYWRRGRAYGDFRDFLDVGGGREALKPPEARRATDDPDIADTLASRRVTELEQARRDKVILGRPVSSTFQVYVERHVAAKENAGLAERHVQNIGHHLQVAGSYFGPHRRIASIGTKDLQDYLAWLRRRPTKRGKPPSEATVRQYLVSLSGLFSRAEAEGQVVRNSVRQLVDKPRPKRGEARFLEVAAAARFLEATKHVAAPIPFYTIIATFLLTGGRYSEVMGLDVKDVNTHRKTVTFRPNEWRGLKTRTSHRTVPFWPQLAAILRRYEKPKAGLLFALDGGLILDLRKWLDLTAKRLDWPAGSVRTRIFRHTYCAARLQTLDRGAPVSPYTVAREMGHGGLSLVERVYGHLGEIRHRSEVVEFRLPRIQNLRVTA